VADKFIPIPVATLLANTIPDFALFLAKPDYGERYALWRREGLHLSREHLRRIKAHGVARVFIQAEDRPKHHRYMVETAAQLVADPRRPSREKAETMYEFSKSAVQCALEEPREENIRTCRELAQEHVRYVVTDPHAVPNLLKIISHDYYTYTHSVNVCSFTVALCHEVGVADLEQLKVIGIGSLLHDMGKSHIGLDILNKPGRLSTGERNLIKKHPEMGVAVLAESGGVPPLAEEIVLSHHEKMDGSGYPRGLTGDQLSLPARACCVADIFDALTTHRSYKSAFAGFRALKLMQQDMKEEVDPELLKVLIRMVGQASLVVERQAA
jgi:putative nucleotidyltransferase with HDIG domain